MKIGIVIAMISEIKSFLESEYKITKITRDHRIIYQTKIKNNDIYAIQSGIGPIDAASATQVLISNFKVDVILNYGVTGAIEKSLKVNDLFIVKNAVNYDFDITPVTPNVKKGQYENFKNPFIPLNSKLIKIAKTLCPELKSVNNATGNHFVEDINEKKWIHKKFKCSICDMELAAIAITAFRNKVKVLSIKSISDTLYGNGKDYEKNVINSSKNAFQLFKKILETI